jgi:hypothetical protein
MPGHTYTRHDMNSSQCPFRYRVLHLFGSGDTHVQKTRDVRGLSHQPFLKGGSVSTTTSAGGGRVVGGSDPAHTHSRHVSVLRQPVPEQ